MPEKSKIKDTELPEKKKFVKSLFFPGLFVIILWIIKIYELQKGIDFVEYGVLPLKAGGLKGIIFAPLIHGSVNHLFNNTIPLLVLGTAIFYFYRVVAYKIVILSWLLSGFWLWFMARYAYHIGASGLIYAWASFLFFSGIIRKNTNLLAISLLVIFLYGSMVWGVFPIEEEVSWEAHLMGALAGLVLAVYYKDMGPVRKLPDWMEEEDEEGEGEAEWEGEDNIETKYLSDDTDEK